MTTTIERPVIDQSNWRILDPGETATAGCLAWFPELADGNGDWDGIGTDLLNKPVPEDVFVAEPLWDDEWPASFADWTVDACTFGSDRKWSVVLLEPEDKFRRMACFSVRVDYSASREDWGRQLGIDDAWYTECELTDGVGNPIGEHHRHDLDQPDALAKVDALLFEIVCEHFDLSYADQSAILADLR